MPAAPKASVHIQKKNVETVYTKTTMIRLGEF